MAALVSLHNINTRQAMYFKVTLWCVSATIVAVEKSISNIYSECVFLALAIQHAMRMACPAL